MTMARGPEGRSFGFAHVSDPHLTSLGALRTRDLLGKRLLGYLTWRQHRRHEHRREVLDELAAELEADGVREIVITGDLTHLGTADECRQAQEWLRSLGPPERVTLVPGNHDRYAPEHWGETVGLWEDYMRGDEPREDGERFPFLRRRGPVALIGLSTARPTAPFLATGRIGQRPLGRLEQLLLQTRREGLCRVILMHHPPAPDAVSRRKALDDGAALCRVIRSAGAELILHGHTHKVRRDRLEGPEGGVMVVGAPSASALGRKRGYEGGYYRMRIESAEGGWALTLESRVFDRSQQRFATGGREQLVLPPAGGRHIDGLGC